jgi:DnaK suppressor protein
MNLLQPLKKQLQSEEKKLKKRRRELDDADPYNDDSRLTNNAAIDADAAEESGHERVFALKNEVDRALIMIRKTLTRIKLGRFGLCEKCGKMIDTDRLAIDPTVSLCIHCAAAK